MIVIIIVIVKLSASQKAIEEICSSTKPLSSQACQLDRKLVKLSCDKLMSARCKIFKWNSRNC